MASDNSDDVVIGTPLFHQEDKVKRYFKPLRGIQPTVIQNGEVSDSEGDMCIYNERKTDDDSLFNDAHYLHALDTLKRKIMGSKRKKHKAPEPAKRPKKRRPINIDRISEYLDKIEQQNREIIRDETDTNTTNTKMLNAKNKYVAQFGASRQKELIKAEMEKMDEES